MSDRVKCPRCGHLTYRDLWKQPGCLLCDDNRTVTPELDVAYRLCVTEFYPGRGTIERIREALKQ